MAKKKEKDLWQNNLRLYRKKAGYTQQELAKILNPKHRYQKIGNMEHGENMGRVKEINTLLTLLGENIRLTFDELFRTGEFSAYIKPENDKYITQFVEEINKIFPVKYTDYEKKALVINCILSVFFENGFDKDEDIRKNIISRLVK
ncbi:MAG: helix-turn-helix transcriptional regulator [Thermosipho sp. (in: Bacteria)]|nr:helix-turn-helix transcriptional regulator [Thermosipho sp. (in: thermotogales)]